MQSFRNCVVEDWAAGHTQFGSAPPPRSGLLHLVTPHDLQDLRTALAHGRLPQDFEAKLARLHEGDLIHRNVEQNSRLFYALLLAALECSFTGTNAADRDRLMCVLAYVRKDDDAIPDYRPGGFVDDHQAVRAAATELAPVLHAFKVWRLRHQVPAMWPS